MSLQLDFRFQRYRPPILAYYPRVWFLQVHAMSAPVTHTSHNDPCVFLLALHALELSADIKVKASRSPFIVEEELDLHREKRVFSESLGSLPEGG